ncbi:cell division protein FtsA [Bacillus massiliglaciei]|uniref:cell division protein FtsA n=1 Tax=Bacillus massiliglaciei TaxID=1816693 RepID=UPI000B10732A|nr:cell division protein FtsA [Bacillus massiliglaciei]
MKEKLVALDIGTRSVVGIILEKAEESYQIIEIISAEHTKRAMLDGQIHDVVEVAKVIQSIKEKLEAKHGPIQKVAVAAAGRALRTESSEVTMEIAGKPMMTRDDILHLEFSAVQEAQRRVAGDEQDPSVYFCVGYSVLAYQLDGQEIGNLIDQSGKEASVGVIATFLPKVVVESLLAALKRTGLEMMALTLEPIAAINVLIPPSMRRLNVALVDIGAGTSDIAITDSGTVTAYGMVPIAGDEITEAISDDFLLDFPLAEKAKRELNSQNTIIVTDILGFETALPKEDILMKIMPALERLADSITKEILRLNNHKPPKAVMLIGGGSQTPELTQLISDRLGLPENRVAVRGIEAIQHLDRGEQPFSGPELVTPIGIAIAADHNPIKFMSIQVNGRPVRLFEMKEMTVADCLLAAGIHIGKLYGRPGIAKIIELNGRQVTVPGEYGTRPLIRVNGTEAALDAPVQNGDRIIAEKGTDGASPVVSLGSLVNDTEGKTVFINGKEQVINAVFTKNGETVDFNTLAEDHDIIRCMVPETIEEVLTAAGREDLLEQTLPFSIQLNGKTTEIPCYSGKVMKNGAKASLSSTCSDQDEIVIMPASAPSLEELADSLSMQLFFSIPVTFNGSEIILSKPVTQFHRGNEVLSKEELIQNGESLKIIKQELAPFLFQDIFRYAEIDLPPVTNGRYILIKNNEETSFHEPVAPGDQLKILWPTVPRQGGGPV